MARSGGGRPPTYKLKDGTRVPSCTTVTGRFKDSKGLVVWANQIGLEGKNMDDEREDAASAGKLAHSWIEDDLHGRPLSPVPVWATDEMVVAARTAHQAFCLWRDQVHLEVLATEQPHVSEQHRFGGTYDCLAVINGKLSLLDWKSSGRVYGDMIVQQAGYHLLVEENDASTAEQVCVLRIGKLHADFHFHAYPPSVIALARRAFLHMRQLYDWDKELGKLL